jgi:hypothetical protein
MYLCKGNFRFATTILSSNRNYRIDYLFEYDYTECRF